MPLIEKSVYDSPGLLFDNPHFTTIFINKIRTTSRPDYKRNRIELNDDDFIDIDFVQHSDKMALILCHGLEGSSFRNYNNTAANYFIQKGFSVFAWNNRSCSGEMNRLPKLYHHAAIEDLNAAVDFVLQRDFQQIFLLGFSMGGVQILNYFGKTVTDERIKAAVAVSSPVYLKSSADALKEGFNQLYLKNFLKAIKRKLRQKSKQFPDLLDWGRLERAKDFNEIDEFYTAPVHGFDDAADYYRKASPGNVLQNIKKPVLILNALDDPFLRTNSYPSTFASNSDFVFLETPKKGGHCAFPLKKGKTSFSEQRAYEFFNSEIISKGL